MNKIRVIDLLNKIANGEEVPKKIKWQDTEYEYNSDYKNYINDYEDLFSVIDGTNFSDEIEIIEEDKEIEKIDNDYYHKTQPEQNQIFKNKINEIIDYLMESKK